MPDAPQDSEQRDQPPARPADPMRGRHRVGEHPTGDEQAEANTENESPS